MKPAAIVVSDTSPIHYLVLIGADALLAKLFGEVLIPPAVAKELSHPSTPDAVRAWMAAPPSWLKVVASQNPPRQLGLDTGETEAILLAQELGIPSLLIDERKGFHVAQSLGLKPFGLLGLLEFCAARGLIDNFEEYISRLRLTRFRYSERLIAEIKQRLANKPT